MDSVIWDDCLKLTRPQMSLYVENLNVCLIQWLELNEVTHSIRV